MRVGFVTAAILVSASVAGATQFAAFNRTAQVRDSDVILKGRVDSVRSDWDETGSTIFTFAEVAVEETWKGMPDGDRITVRTPGGIVRGIGLEVEGAARFAAGERVVLFLARAGDVYQPVGMIFGKYSVEDSGATEFLVGSLPPAVDGASRFPFVSISADELRQEVRRIVEEESR